MQIDKLSDQQFAIEVKRFFLPESNKNFLPLSRERLYLQFTDLPGSDADLIRGRLLAEPGLFIERQPEPKDGSVDILAATGKETILTLIEDSALSQHTAALLKEAIVQNINADQRNLVLGGYSLPLGQRTLIMGILNTTPDSFSDGGQFSDVDDALDQAYSMAAAGADIIDIGGESTRPGHKPISAAEELQRVLPLIDILKRDQNFKLPLSIDTYKAEVAEAAFAAGVEMLNDIWGLKGDHALAAVASRYGVTVCLMHNRNHTNYDHLIAEIIGDLKESTALAHQAGIGDEQIIIDPGIGFGKDLAQNLEVMRCLNQLCNLGYPLLLGTSRKSMIGKTLDLPPDQRMEGTAATVACGIAAGADLIRVHDVLEMKRVAQMTDAIYRR